MKMIKTCIMKNYKSVIINVILITICAVSVFPFIMMIMMSTYKSSELYLSFPIIPSDYLLENLKTVFDAPFLIYYWNSIYVAVTHTLLVLTISSMAGFALAKYKFRLRKLLYSIIIATLIIPAQLSTIGFVLEMKAFNMLNTHLPFILTAASPFAVFWITSYINAGLPDELLESARIDGCSEPKLFIRIVIPLIKPALGTMALLAFLGSWNNFMLPTIMLTKQKLYTLPVGIKNFATQYTNDVGAQILAINLAIFPILILFSIYSKNLIRGITAGAIKG